MKINVFLVLTLAVFLLIASHVLLYVDHQKLHEEGGQCNCGKLEGEEYLMVTSLIISSFLFVISLLAYLQNHSGQILLVATAYFILVIHCVAWLIGAYFIEGDLVHTLTHELDWFLLAPTMVLVLIALYRRGK